MISLLSIVFTQCSSTQSISFNEHIRPILNEHCVQCHGGVKRQGGLSLLFREAAVDQLESGKHAIVAGKPGQSELIKRIEEEDMDLRMPPEGEALNANQVALLKKWIEEGAQWETHWAYIAPEKQELPQIESSWPKNGIDQFILERLNQEGLVPNKKADKYTLIRRLSLDLTGLPPSPEEVDAFIQDESVKAYEKLVDRLLESPAYGERWAAMWLDLARYADSKGYEKDHHRDIWMYRDWVIKAFNEDMPFDQFTIEQLAGDLLPQPSQDQYIATGFHRNTMNNNEGGVQNEEYRMAAVIDRVNTTWDVWQGTSFGCAQCHDHPYDPFTQEEYFKYMDFFNNTKDEDTGDDAPVLNLYEALEEENIAEIKNWILNKESTDQALNASQIEELLRITEPKFWSYRSEVITKTAKVGDDYILEGRDGGIAKFPAFPLLNTTKFLVKGASSAPDSKVIIHLDSINGEIIGEWQLGQAGGVLDIFELKPIEGYRDLYFHFQSPSAAYRSKDQVGHILWILPQQAFSVFDQEGGDKMREEFLRILNTSSKTSPIIIENPPSFTRKTHILDRGSWLSPTEEVSKAVPGSMPAFKPDQHNNRLGLAQWMVNGEHPLTSRVIVNRIWEQIFGTGIVLTLEDFGTQGEPPSHQGLLDYLAKRLEQEHDWSIKSLLKEIVLSATYQQSSEINAVAYEKDPYNRFLARGPRFRLSAEQIRDQALAVSGLLSKKIYGPSVMPYLPEGVWNVVYQQYTQVQWELSEGEDRYRRGIYTYWKRTSPYPSMITFDSQSREVCISRRIRTNTPLQALVLLNDPVYIEAANALGALMEEQGSGNLEKAISYGYKRALAQEAPEEAVQLLKKLYQEAETRHTEIPAAKLTAYQESEGEHELKTSMAVVANAILNLDAFVVKN